MAAAPTRERCATLQQGEDDGWWALGPGAGWLQGRWGRVKGRFPAVEMVLSCRPVKICQRNL